MQIKVDEDLPRAIAGLLREAGHDARTVQDESLGGASDARLRRIARREGRLLLTADKGFADLRRFPPGTHPGIVLLRPREDGIRPAVALVQALLSACPLESLSGCLAVATPGGIRIRRPPSAPR